MRKWITEYLRRRRTLRGVNLGYDIVEVKRGEHIPIA